TCALPIFPSGGTRSKYNVTTMENIILYSKHSALTGVEVDCIRTRTASVASIVVELQRHRARHANAFKAAVARCGTIDDVLLIGTGFSKGGRILFGVESVTVAGGIGLAVHCD